ncbi:MAG TPA: ribosome maturation factor RimP [Jatrophihabitantaceae bacterium]|nr:ribosome maturation factor RimP [Jatrophihabitantaceae bacterium]
MPPASAGRSASDARERLLETLRPVVEATGYELEDVSVTSAGRRSLVRVSVDTDGPGPGIDLDGIAVVSRAVSDALDAAGAAWDAAFAGPYVLEVSSPGVDRPLTEPRHWRRATGRLVQVPVGERAVTGRVRAVTESGVVLDVAGTEHEYGWTELGRGKVQVEFSRPDGDNAASDDAGSAVAEERQP